MVIDLYVYFVFTGGIIETIILKGLKLLDGNVKDVSTPSQNNGIPKMTTRLIEECFWSEIEESEMAARHVYVFDPSKVTADDMRKLLNSKPGAIIRLNKDNIPLGSVVHFVE